MSVQCAVSCLDCLVDAPGIGDGGFVGGPSLDAGTCDCGEWGELPTFGSLYEPLAAIGIRPYELEAFKKWLSAHRGHRLHLHSDHDDSFPPEIDLIHGSWEAKVRCVAIEKEAAAEKKRHQDAGTFVMGTFTLSCQTCGIAIDSGTPELLMKLPTLEIDQRSAEAFAEAWRSVLAKGRPMTHRLMSASMDPDEQFVHRMVRFLREHQAHTLRAIAPGGITTQ